MDSSSSRRDFVKHVALAGLALTPLSGITSALNFETSEKKDHLRFLFQGDSITDGNRGRNNDPNHLMGHGYAFSIASRVGATFPEKQLAFFNRGVSGNKISDMALRWQADTLDIKPDVLSILIGINDVDAALKNKKTVAVTEFEGAYRILLQETKTQFPGCLLVLCEPFILPVGRVKENWDAWNNEIQKTQSVVNNLSKEFKTVFVPLQQTFNNATTRSSADYWIWDGIHPTVAGHELITRAWLKQVGKQLHFLKKLN